ncbi:MAG: hypothetical protein SLRJCFUN_002027 [Candidatus Fervidibacter sp.]
MAQAPAPTKVSLLWRCPECGHIFAPQPTTIRCPQCGENLRKCRYCQYADTATWECTNPRIRYTYGDELGRFRIPEPDHVWACPENRPALAPNPWQFFIANPLLRALGWGAAVSIGLLLLFRFVILPWVRGPEVPESALLTAQVLAPSQVVMGEPIRLMVTLFNSEQVPVNQWLLMVGGSLVENSEAPQVTPAPIAPIERTKDHLRIFLAGSPPGQSVTVELLFPPQEIKRGTYTLTLDAYGYLGTPPQQTAYRVFIAPSRQVQVRVR